MGFFSSDSSTLAIQNTSTASGSGRATTGNASPIASGHTAVTAQGGQSPFAVGERSSSIFGTGNQVNTGNLLNFDASNKFGNLVGSTVTVTDNGAVNKALDSLSNALAGEQSSLQAALDRLATPSGGTTVIGPPQPQTPPTSAADAGAADNSRYWKLGVAVLAGVALWIFFGRK